MAKRRTWWDAVAHSQAVHARRHAPKPRDERGRFISRKENERRQRQRRGAVEYEPEARIPHIPTVADQAGLDEALDVARDWGIHPDEWAEEVSDAFDERQHDLYEAYFYPAGGSAYGY